MSLFERSGRILALFERGAIILAMAVMVATMFVMTFDVARRYLFNAPLVWAYDVISIYLLAAIVFLALADTQRAGHHISVNLVFRRFGRKPRHVMRLIGTVLAAFFFLILAWRGALIAHRKFVRGEVIDGLILWPTWIAAILVPIGAGLLFLRFFHTLIGHTASLVTGEDLVSVDVALAEDIVRAED